MPQFYPLAGCEVIAALVQAELAASKLRLFQDSLPAPDPSTPIADYVANEADFTGYPAGGETITAWLDPILDPLGGYSIGSGTEQFATDNPTTVGNIIAGAWLENAAGDIISVVVFTTPIPMQMPGQGIPIDLRLVFPTGEA